jgi:hypothetical protein
VGKRSQGKAKWAKRHDAPTVHTVRLWVCADCKQPTQLIGCADGKQRCHYHKEKYDRALEFSRSRTVLSTSSIVPAGQLVQPPRVG